MPFFYVLILYTSSLSSSVSSVSSVVNLCPLW